MGCDRKFARSLAGVAQRLIADLVNSFQRHTVHQFSSDAIGGLSKCRVSKAVPRQIDTTLTDRERRRRPRLVAVITMQ